MAQKKIAAAVGWPRGGYWRWWWPWRWWFKYVWPGKCYSCGRRWREHRDDCYFA